MRRTLLFTLLVCVALTAIGAQSALAAAPTITGFTPSSGPAEWSVTVTGTGFTGTTQVTFTPTDPTYPPKWWAWNVKNDATIVATVPTYFTHPPLAATITVQTPGGPATSSGDFTIDGGFTLSEYSASPGESITLTGSAFSDATKVLFGTWRAPVQGNEPFSLAKHVQARFQVVSDTKITTTVPTEKSGTECFIEVVSAAGTSVSRGSVDVISPRLLSADFGTMFAWRPAIVTPSGDGAFNIGRQGGRIHWRVWRNTWAYGTGTVWIDNGVPNNALGRFVGYRGTVTAYRVRGAHFTRMTIRWQWGSGRKAAVTLKLAYQRGAGGRPLWYWASS
jgi:hypothetical protein